MKKTVKKYTPSKALIEGYKAGYAGKPFYTIGTKYEIGTQNYKDIMNGFMQGESDRKDNTSSRVSKAAKKKPAVNPPVKKVVKKNPIAPTRQRAIDKGVNLYQKFHGEKPGFIDSVSLPKFGEVGFVIGDLAGVMYDTIRDGKKCSFLHEFDKKSRPLLISNHDGTQIAIIGGKYNFTEDGIVDR